MLDYCIFLTLIRNNCFSEKFSHCLLKRYGGRRNINTEEEKV